MHKTPEQLQNKIQKLPPWAREIFSDFVEELYDRESNMVVGFLQASRRELRGELTSVKQEQEQLRGTPLPALSAKDRYATDHRSAALARRGVSPDKLQRYLQRKLAEKAPRSDSRSSTSMSYMSETSLDFDSRPSTSFSRAGTFSQEGRSPAPPRTSRRGTPAPPKEKPKQEEEVLKAKTEALLAAAGEVEARNESERDRQWEKVRRAKERKKQRQQAQADLAAQMLDLAREVAAAQTKEKEKQEQKIKERLEEMKRKKASPDEK